MPRGECTINVNAKALGCSTRPRPSGDFTFTFPFTFVCTYVFSFHLQPSTFRRYAAASRTVTIAGGLSWPLRIARSS